MTPQNFIFPPGSSEDDSVDDDKHNCKETFETSHHTCTAVANFLHPKIAISIADTVNI
jgi:hypothetical protein